MSRIAMQWRTGGASYFMRRSIYRVGQFWSGLGARVSRAELAQVQEILGDQPMALFTAMPVDAQRHSLNVLASLGASAQCEPALAVAALLHDVGKVAARGSGIGLSLWLRGPLVLLETALPGVAAAWASAEPKHGWRYVLHVQAAHPAIGAAWAAEAGCSELACWLIAEHQTRLDRVQADASRRSLLAALQQADGEN